MDIVGKISKGSNMDQIYLPKNRVGFESGQYVLISPLDGKIGKKEEFKPFFYGLKGTEPLKLSIIKDIFGILRKIYPENIIITGSFLEKGFRFNDIDILIIGDFEKPQSHLSNRFENPRGTLKLKGYSKLSIKDKITDIKRLNEEIEKRAGIKSHIISINKKNLMHGLSTDPLYSLMLSKCISKNRIIFKTKRIIDYRILDFQLLKSKTLPENFNILNGEEKYYLTLNMISILLFIQNKKLSKKIVNEMIEKNFDVSIDDIKRNIVEKGKFIRKYRELYTRTFNMIMRRINEQK